MKYAYEYHGKNRFFFITDSAVASAIDPKACNAVNSKLMLRLAIVLEEETVKKEAFNQQQLFGGSYRYFKTVTETKDWAKTVIRDF
jgi:hypothetical protein